MKAHKLAQLVNDLRDISAHFYNHESLRDRISQTLADHGICEYWPSLDRGHLLALTLAYEKGFSAGLEDRNTENVFSPVGGQAAAFDVGLEEGRSARQRRKPYVPEGYKLVPIEPTKEMVQKACSDHGYPSGDRNIYVQGYRSMLAAAPKTEEQ